MSRLSCTLINFSSSIRSRLPFCLCHVCSIDEKHDWNCFLIEEGRKEGRLCGGLARCVIGVDWGWWCCSDERRRRNGCGGSSPLPSSIKRPYLYTFEVRATYLLPAESNFSLQLKHTALNLVPNFVKQSIVAGSFFGGVCSGTEIHALQSMLSFLIYSALYI